MPPKRSVRSSLTKKIQAIKTRLIEISLKVDDLIYSNKPITEQEAEMYMKEIVSYRNICCNDERSLQVIEKLTRFMKAIIAEQEELRFDHNITDDDSSVELDVRSPSPVYSLPDEDRIQLTQNEIKTLVDVNSHNNPNNIIASKAHFHDETHITQSIQGLEVTGNENGNADETMQVFNNFIAPNPNQDMELHKALLNLTITETNVDDELMSIDVESSQSVLNNIDPLQYPSSPPIETLNVNEEIIELTKTANNLNIKLSNKTKDFHVNDNSVIATSPILESQETSINGREKVDKLQETGTIHFEFPSSKNNNNIRSNANRTVEKPFSIQETGFDNQKPVVFMNANTTTSFENKTQSNIESQAYDKKLKMRDQIAANLLKHNNNSKVPTSIIKSSSNNICEIQKLVSSSTDKANSVQQEYNSVKDNTQKYACNTQHSKETTTNKNKSFINVVSKKKIQVAQFPEWKSVHGKIKKKRGQWKNQEDGNKTTKKDANVKKETQKGINNNDGTNKTVEYQPRRKYKKQSNTHDNITEETISLPIYNKNVENDLSWLENIRFVREISENEYDRNILIDHNFWDNDELPLNYDQNDYFWYNG